MGTEIPSPNSQQGLSLIEVLVALLILSFVALGIAGLFSHAMLVNASGHDYAVLSAEARFAMESLQALPFNDAALTATTPPATVSWTPATEGFTIEYTVEDFRVQNWTDIAVTTSTPPGGPTWPAAGGAANLKRISMTVSSGNVMLQGQRVLTLTSLKISG